MYVPAKLDFSDLSDIMALSVYLFHLASLLMACSFRGTPKHPDLGFDQTAKALARNGVSPGLPRVVPSDEAQQCFAERMFRLEDLQAYMMRLFLEYAVSLP